MTVCVCCIDSMSDIMTVCVLYWQFTVTVLIIRRQKLIWILYKTSILFSSRKTRCVCVLNFQLTGWCTRVIIFSWRAGKLLFIWEGTKSNKYSLSGRHLELFWFCAINDCRVALIAEFGFWSWKWPVLGVAADADARRTFPCLRFIPLKPEVNRNDI